MGVEGLPLCVRAADTLDRHRLMRIGRKVHEIVDGEASANQCRTVVNRGVSQELDDFKDVYDRMEDILTDKANEIRLRIPRELIVSVHVTYLPHMGFHIDLPKDPATGEGIYEEADWHLVFTTPSRVYYKDNAMRQLDEDLGDLYSAMCEMEVEIAYGLAQTVLEHETLLTAASDLCGELDCWLAFAHVAQFYNLKRPTITEANIVQIKGGRHLLQEMVVPSFVVNDTYLCGGNGQHPTDEPSMLMLTGPNYSGKSVYQKQVALIVYLAQTGSFVPADAATIGITDKILTRITTRETVSKVQSAFMIDLQQIAIALNSCTRRSLVVIDEFGKGTDTYDGAGLAAGVFQYLLSLGAEAPRTLAATHFHEIFNLGLFDVPNISFAHMQVHVAKSEVENPNEHNTEITYLYNLCPGRSDVSYGAQCAALNGVPKEVVKRSVELARLVQRGEDLVAVCSALKENEVQALRHAEKAARMFLAEDFDQNWSKDELTSALDAMLMATGTAGRSPASL
jgi:DNA mismatch repair protein MSH5